MTYGVVTVTLNSATTIGRTIASVFAQTRLPAEYIFVDGDSTDGTNELLEGAIAAERRLGVRCKLIHQHGSGIPQAWNIGLRELRTDVVCILNSDDWYEPEAARTVMSCFAADPAADVVIGAGRYVGNGDGRASTICRPRPFGVLPVAMAVIHPACFVRREIYVRVGEFDERYQVAADYDFIYRCRKARVRFARCDDVLVNVRTGGFAETHRALARREMAEIGARHSAVPLLPPLGRAVRWALGR